MNEQIIVGTPQTVKKGTAGIVSWTGVADARIVSCDIQQVIEKTPLLNNAGVPTGSILTPGDFQGNVTVEVESDKALPVEGADSGLEIDGVSGWYVLQVNKKWERTGLHQAVLTVFKHSVTEEEESV
jgi:hypothetical protein